MGGNSGFLKTESNGEHVFSIKQNHKSAKQFSSVGARNVLEVWTLGSKEVNGTDVNSSSTSKYLAHVMMNLILGMVTKGWRHVGILKNQGEPSHPCSERWNRPESVSCFSKHKMWMTAIKCLKNVQGRKIGMVRKCTAICEGCRFLPH